MNLNPFLNFFLSVAIMISSAGLWRLGGMENKSIRRIGVPLLLTAVCLFYGAWKESILTLVLLFLTLRLPFTLKGDDLSDYALLNWLYIPLWATLLNVQSLVFAPWWACLLSIATMAMVAALSNLEKTREIFTWDRCEYVFGAAVAFPILVAVAK